MRNSSLRQLIVLLLLAGVTASLLPFGRDALARERWSAWLRGFAPVTHREALDAALAEVLSDVPPDTRSFVQAIVQRQEADPAWFGLDSFEQDELLRLSEQMAAIPVSGDDQPALVQDLASPPPLPGPPVADLYALGAHALQPVLPQTGQDVPAASQSAHTVLVGTALSPRAP